MNNHTAWHKLIISLCALAIISAALTLNHFLKSDVETKQLAVAENWLTLEVILLRECHAKWPLMGDEYETCVGKIKQMYREDI